ncbi:cytochrome P450 [Rhodococcus sp. 15-2388-1-1a]|nr:cytochrome P450 [Rhodococcus sp. 15-2388-1-1a]
MYEHPTFPRTEPADADPATRRERYRSSSSNSVPTYDVDLYSAHAIADPYTHYRALRELGPVVWLSKHDMYAVSRYSEVHDVLADDSTFRSGDAIALNKLARFFGSKTALVSDADVHAARRKLVTSRLTPKALRPLRAEVAELAQGLVQTAVSRGDIDGVADLALALPLTVVPNLIGWPEYGRAKLLDWGIAGFDFAGPTNRLFFKSLPRVIAMRMFVGKVVRRRDFAPDSAGEELLAAVDDGTLSKSECASLLIDLLAPSIDTTASIIAAALQLFADNPDQWNALRNDRSLMPKAINEVVRLASPLRAFQRRVNNDTVVAGTNLAAGSRLLMLFASANRDDRVWDDADAFDISRDLVGHVGFGYGVHSCAGQGLGRLETSSILEALLDHVESIERRGPGKRASNNVIYRWEELPLRLVPLSGEK